MFFFKTKSSKMKGLELRDPLVLCKFDCQFLINIYVESNRFDADTDDRAAVLVLTVLLRDEAARRRDVSRGEQCAFGHH